MFNRTVRLAVVAAGIAFAGATLLPGGLMRAQQDAARHAREQALLRAPGQEEADRVAIDADDIGGVVLGPAGPEAGVWVIAETDELPTRFRKIVVTDDRGRYVLPDLPDATYSVWVRGYGLVDSRRVRAVRGRKLALTAVAAPNAKAAAEYYPANYWYSLMQVPPRDAFPISVKGDEVTVSGSGERGRKVIETQSEWAGLLKCTACHQVGNKATRELSKNLGTFDSSAKAWERALKSGQTGDKMAETVDARWGHERGLAMFADWSDRIAAGEVPEAPPRPQGVERNLVLTLWDFSTPTAFVHDTASTDKRTPTVNAYGTIYGADWSANALVTVDPVKHTKNLMKVPVKDEGDRDAMLRWSARTQLEPSPYWGDEIIWDDPVNAHTPMLDRQGRVWFNVDTHSPDRQPAYCKAGSDNPFAKNAPIAKNSRGVDMYDPRTGKISVYNLCFNSSHLMFAEDKDDTIYFSIIRGFGGIGWLKTRVLLETGDEEKAQGWCPPILDYNGDGKLGAYTLPNEPADPSLDRYIRSQGYGVATSPVDDGVWYVSPGDPGFIARMVTGPNPPSTCRTEIYTAPRNPNVPGYFASQPHGIDLDRNGVAWTAFTSTNQLGSFDRRKCKGALNGPKATGEHCPEGWTLYVAPGPRFKGVTDDIGTDFFYYNWVDQFDTLGLGKNIPIVNGTWSDSLIALDPATGKWTVLRVPYPLGFYSRGMDGRIDDPNAGWKGRGLWSANATRVSWHNEGGKGSTSYVVHFQLRPDPLAR